MALRRKDIMLKATFKLVSWPVCHAWPTVFVCMTLKKKMLSSAK